MSKKIKLSKHELFDIIDALPKGSTISSVDSDYVSGESSHYGGYNDFYKEEDNEYHETIHTYYGCSIIDVIEDLATEAQDDGDPHDGIVIADNNGKIIHEWLPGTIEIDINENIDDLKQRIAKRYIEHAIHKLVRAYNVVQYDAFSCDCEVFMRPFAMDRNIKDHDDYQLRENCRDVMHTKSPMPLLKYLSTKLLTLVKDEEETK